MKDKLNINIQVHTILYTIAPSNSGKSYFCNNHLVPKLKSKYPDLNIQYLSSDDIRRDLLGSNDIHKHDSEMLQISSQAFEYLFFKIKLLTSFPISADVIIVDSTGLSGNFRESLSALAKEVNYNLIPIVFDYSDKSDYYSYTDDKTDITVIDRHLEKLSNIQFKKSDPKIIIDRKDFNYYDIAVNITNIDTYRSHILDEHIEYVVVSDIHGCLDEYKKLIYANNCSINENGIIVSDNDTDNIVSKIYIVQDYVDKGYDILNTIEFIYNNTKAGKILPLIGNHENYVYKRLKGEVKPSDIDSKFFNSVLLLEDPNNQKYKEMFLYLISVSKVFYRHKNFFVNHAPCELKYLGKLDNKSLKEQRNFMYPKFDEIQSLEENIKLVEQSIQPLVKNKYATYNSKTIVWGHVAMKNYKRFDNVYMIDTGCVSGGKLTSISFYKNEKYIRSVDFDKSKNTYKSEEDILNLFEK